MSKSLHSLYWEKGSDPIDHISTEGFETVTPLGRTEFLDLLSKKPVGDWEKMIEVLCKHHLIILPSRKLVDSTLDIVLAGVDENLSLAGLGRARAAKVLREQQEAAAKRKEKRAVAHAKLVKEQGEAAARRKAARAASEAARMAAISARRSARSYPKVALESLKKGQEVKRWLEADHAAQLSQCGDAFEVRVALQGLPAVNFGRAVSRPIRPMLKLAKVGEQAAPNVSHETAFANCQFSIRRAERHLSYLFNEGEEGWTKVQRKWGRKPKRFSQESVKAEAVVVK